MYCTKNKWRKRGHQVNRDQQERRNRAAQDARGRYNVYFIQFQL